MNGNWTLGGVMSLTLIAGCAGSLITWPWLAAYPPAWSGLASAGVVGGAWVCFRAGVGLVRRWSMRNYGPSPLRSAYSDRFVPDEAFAPWYTGRAKAPFVLGEVRRGYSAAPTDEPRRPPSRGGSAVMPAPNDPPPKPWRGYAVCRGPYGPVVMDDAGPVKVEVPVVHGDKLAQDVVRGLLHEIDAERARAGSVHFVATGADEAERKAQKR